jgi:prepilin-type N-terminal cleavage/methylation domain-containing protein
MTAKRTKRESGFTLIELLIAVSILSAGLLALGSMQVSAISGSAYSANVTEGSTLAADRLEKLLALPYTHADLSSGAHVDPNPPTGRTVRWNIVDNAPLANTKTITLTVQWMDHAAQKSVSMQRIIARML